jgi:hypothetical protein
MMITIAAALCMLASQRSSSQIGLHWPMVPNTLFVVNGIDANGAATIGHIKVAEKSGVTVIGKPEIDATGASASLVMPPYTTPWKTLQIVFSATADGPLASFGGIDVAIKDGYLWFSKAGNQIKIAPVVPDGLNDVQLLSHFDSLLVQVNGTRSAQSVLPTKALVPIEIGKPPFKGTIIGVVAYTRELSADELFVNGKAAQSMAKALFADTAKATVEAELTAITPVPDLERIRPYRSALLAEEYKVIRVVSGRMSALKPGTKIRVLRYGIKAGEKTALKDAKLGDHATMPLQLYDPDSKISREFRVDDLEPDITTPIFVDLTPIE